MLLILFIVIQLADVATTFAGLKKGDSEANLLPAFLFSRFGFWPSVIGIKLAGLALALAATFLISNGGWFTGVLDLIGAAVLVNNWRVLHAGP